MDLIIGLVAGAGVGWLAGVLMRTDEQPAVPLHVIAGSVGGALAALLAAPMIGASSSDRGSFSIGSLLVSLLGALILLVIVNLVRRGAAR